MLRYGYSDFRSISIRFWRKIAISIPFDSRHQLNGVIKLLCGSKSGIVKSRHYNAVESR